MRKLVSPSGAVVRVSDTYAERLLKKGYKDPEAKPAKRGPGRPRKNPVSEEG